jgi:hypothetical protein
MGSDFAGGATVLVLLVSVPAAYYSARHRSAKNETNR